VIRTVELCPRLQSPEIHNGVGETEIGGVKHFAHVAGKVIFMSLPGFYTRGKKRPAAAWSAGIPLQGGLGKRETEN